jgi:hypothetical protein
MAEAPKNLDLRWGGADNVPVAACNVFLSQFTHGEFTLTFGYASPPTNPEASEVVATTVARISMSPVRMQELIDVLKGNLENFQKATITVQTETQTKH